MYFCVPTPIHPRPHPGSNGGGGSGPHGAGVPPTGTSAGGPGHHGGGDGLHDAGVPPKPFGGRPRSPQRRRWPSPRGVPPPRPLGGRPRATRQVRFLQRRPRSLLFEEMPPTHIMSVRQLHRSERKEACGQSLSTMASQPGQNKICFFDSFSFLNRVILISSNCSSRYVGALLS